jgi:hypothetical protein
MAVIIGAGSTVFSAQFPNGGIVSFQLGFNPQVDRLYEIGSFDPYDTSVTRTQTLSVTAYGKRATGQGGTAIHLLTPSIDCVDTGAINIEVNPASCVPSLRPFIGDFFLNNYSYSKDNLGYGQETWSFTAKPTITGFSGNIVMLRGIAEGTVKTGPGTMPFSLTGCEIDEVTIPNPSNDELDVPIESESGSVSAGAIGNYDIQRFIIPTQVGGSQGRGTTVDGLDGETSITIPLTPVYL